MGKSWVLAAAWIFFAAGFVVLGLSGNALEYPTAEDGFLRIPIGTDPPSLDPARVTDTTSSAIAARLFDTLVRQDKNLNIVPGLAKSFDVSADGLTCTFHLHPGVKFDGLDRTVTAEDVKYSLERLLDPTVSRRAVLLQDTVVGADALWATRLVDPTTTARCEGIETDGELTVRIRLMRKSPTFLQRLAMVNTAVVAREHVERLGKAFEGRPYGTGAFRLTEWVHDSHVRLSARDDAWEGKPKIRGIFYRVVPELQVAYQEYKAGRFDVCRVPNGMLGKIRATPEGKQIHGWTNLSTLYLAFTQTWVERFALDGAGKEHPAENLTDEDLAKRGWKRGSRIHTYEPYGRSRKLRQAVNFAVDRERLCRVILDEQAVPARGVLPPGLPGYNSDIRGYTFDPVRAKALLSEAGFPGGKGLPKIPLYYNHNPTNKMIIDQLQIDLKAVGIELETVSLEWGAYLNAVRGDKPPPIFRLGWVADYPDPENFLYLLFHSDKAGDTNRSRYENPAVDALIDRARAAANTADRYRLFQEAENLIVTDAPWTFISHGRSNLLIKPYVSGIRETTTGLDTGTELPQVDFLRVEITLPAGTGRSPK